MCFECLTNTFKPKTTDNSPEEDEFNGGILKDIGINDYVNVNAKQGPCGDALWI